MSIRYIFKTYCNIVFNEYSCDGLPNKHNFETRLDKVTYKIT